MKPLLVGEVNPYGSDPFFALYHLPREASGNRLREILGLTDSAYMERFDRVNLCTGKWRLREAQTEANRICDERRGQVVVLLGSKVRDAFRTGGITFTVVENSDRTKFVLLPHPSGMNRAWNDPTAKEKAREVMRKVGAL